MDPKYHERKLLKQIQAYSRQIKRLYNEAILEASIKTVFHYQQGGKRVNVVTDGPTFNLDLQPIIRKQIDTTVKQLSADILRTITQSTKDAWGLANKKNDILIRDFVGKKQIPKPVNDQWFDPNKKALDQFVNRVVGGMGLSERVWNLVKPFRHELEAGLADGISKGRSAAAMAADIKRHLNEPDKLFRRVRDEKGKLQLSKAAKAYNPGQGVYRSSHKNAMRVTRTETNMAYRNADIERWRKLDFVLGYSVKLSLAHPKYDLCFANPNVKVMTSKGQVPIYKIKAGDLVLTHTGKYQRVLQKFKTACKEVNTVTISGSFAYDNRGKTQAITATDNHPFLVNGEWKPIGDIKPGDECQMLANECKKCGKLVPYTREYCSKSCASFIRFKGEQVRKNLAGCSEEIDRILKNHNGEYKFMPFKINKVEKKVLKRPGLTKYNMEVENDNSYIVNGFVVHNCDPLAQDYPKWFTWAGWHVQCLCYAVPILISKKDFQAQNEEILGISDKKADIKLITEMPKAFTDYLENNRDRIKGWKNKPYWLKENPAIKL